jgi:hypothetical protein
VQRVRFVFAALALCCLAATLAGCDTTRDKSSRAKIFADRSLDSRKPVVVKKEFSPITVDKVQVVGRGKKALIVVALSNNSAEPYAALPINILAGEKILNRGPEIPYFDNHVPAIDGNAQTVWIFKPGKRIKSGRLSALVGAPNKNATVGKQMPDLRVEDLDIATVAALGTVKNASGTPQYSVEIYVTTAKGGRYTSAATGRVVKLSSKGERPFNLPLVGKPGNAEPKVSLGPAIFVQSP